MCALLCFLFSCRCDVDTPPHRHVLDDLSRLLLITLEQILMFSCTYLTFSCLIHFLRRVFMDASCGIHLGSDLLVQRDLHNLYVKIQLCSGFPVRNVAIHH